MTSAPSTQSSRRHRGGFAALALGLGIVLAPLYALRASAASAENEPPGARSAPSVLDATTSTTTGPETAQKQGRLDECGQPITEFLDLGGDGLLHELEIEREPGDECGAGAIGACEVGGPSKDGDYPDCCPTARSEGSGRACVRFPVATNCMDDDTNAPNSESCTIYVRTARNCHEAGFALAGCTTLTNNLFKSCRSALESAAPKGICRQAQMPLYQACAAGQVTDCATFREVSCASEPNLAGCPAPPGPTVTQPLPPPEQRPEPPTPPDVGPTPPTSTTLDSGPGPGPESQRGGSDSENVTDAELDVAGTGTTEDPPTLTETSEPDGPTPPPAASEPSESGPADTGVPEAPFGSPEPGSLAAAVDRWLIPEFTFDAAPAEIAGQLAADVASGGAPGLLVLPLVAAAGAALALGVDRARRSNG